LRGRSLKDWIKARVAHFDAAARPRRMPLLLSFALVTLVHRPSGWRGQRRCGRRSLRRRSRPLPDVVARPDRAIQADFAAEGPRPRRLGHPVKPGDDEG